ncbi:MAG: hypothetical protein KJP06_05030, partial [Deltaproteobacteria bacterium]|nr:hypothetical protein [Deltaproteobacteria bacterium]
RLDWTLAARGGAHVEKPEQVQINKSIGPDAVFLQPAQIIAVDSQDYIRYLNVTRLLFVDHATYWAVLSRRSSQSEVGS